VTPPSMGAKVTRWVPRSFSSSTSRVWPSRATKLVTRSCTRPRPPGCESHSTRAPARGQSPSRRARWCRPSMKLGQRVVSYHSSSAWLARPGTTMLACTRPIAGLQPQLAADEVEARRHGVQARGELAGQPPALGLAGVGETVEAPRAALGVLPLPGDEALRLELA